MMALALLAQRIRESLGFSGFLLCVLMLCQLPHLEALEEGETCMIKNTLLGVCQTSSKCEPIIRKYIKTGRLTASDVPSCGLGPLEEIVCCPVAECCDNGVIDKGPSQAQSSTTTRTILLTTTTRKTEISSTEVKERAINLNVDVESPYFDLQLLLSNQAKPQSKPQLEPKPSVPAITQLMGMEQFQSVGPWGQANAPNHREPKIINRPLTMTRPSPTFGQRPITSTMTGISPTFGQRPITITTRRPQQQQQQPRDYVRLVNDRLRQQGMNIVPAQENNQIQLPSERPLRTTTTTTTRTITNIDLDPWAPFRFRENPINEPISNELGNGADAAAFGPETTTIRVIQPTPTTRVDVPDRPVVRACRLIENRQKEEQLTPHILDGIPVEEGFYPHMAAIAFLGIGNYQYRCGGSLISTRHVLTAAHCFNSEMPDHVRLGSVNIAEPLHHQDIPVLPNITIHPEYLSSSKYNDIAILTLEREAELNYWVYPACLSLDLHDPPLTAQLFVAGWGTMNQTTRRTSKILLRAPLSIVPVQQCNESYAVQVSSKRNLKDGVTASLMCAADTKKFKKDACSGDSGGPLILETDIVNSKYTILGIINSGFGCATQTPGLYTRVASFLDWIESIVWPNNFVL